MSNLRLLNETTISSSVSSVNITDVFSTDFDIYKIVVSGISLVGTSQSDLNMRLINASGSVISDSEYDYAHQIMRTDASFTEQRATNQTLFLRTFAESTDQAPESTGAVVYVFNPNSSTYTFILYQNMDAGAGLKIGMKGVGVYKRTDTISGFQLIENNSPNRPFNSGAIRTFGIRVDS